MIHIVIKFMVFKTSGTAVVKEEEILRDVLVSTEEAIASQVLESLQEVAIDKNMILSYKSILNPSTICVGGFVLATRYDSIDNRGIAVKIFKEYEY